MKIPVGRAGILALLGCLVVLGIAAAGAAPTASGTPRAGGELGLKAVSPPPNGTAYSTTPTLVVDYTDSVGTVNASTVFVYLDGVNETIPSRINVTASEITYTVPSILKLSLGANNATVVVRDSIGRHQTLFWTFTVASGAASSGNPFASVKPVLLLEYIGLGAGLCGAGVGGYILYLKQTTRFTFRRYFATHPVRRTYLVLYLPLGVAFMFVLLGLSYVYSTPGLPSNAVDYVLIVAIFIGLTAFGIDARHEMARIRAYERAFAQFLFEMADAMRGGIDPAKALVELAKTHTNILAKHLRIAADSVRLGRPFESILREMVVPMQSRLIARYAGLVADASGIGGETATVVYRAAKDMDDFVKIEEEREKQLMLPVAVIYIAFGVLMAVLFSLLYIAPTLGTLNVSFLGLGNPLSGSGGGPATAIPKLTFSTLKERFFELMVINALGTGAIIGAFTEGRARYGIIHSLGLVGATAVAFLILFP